MDILKDLTATLVEYFQAPVLAGRVCGPGLATTSIGGGQSPDEDGGSESLHGEGLCVTDRKITGPIKRACEAVLPLPPLRGWHVQFHFSYFMLLGNHHEKQKAVQRHLNAAPPGPAFE